MTPTGSTPRRRCTPSPLLPPRRWAGNVASDLIRAAAFATLVFLAHGCLDRRPSGRLFEQFQVAFVQEALRRGPASDADFEAGGGRCPLVVDISRLHPDKKQRTDRRMLDALIPNSGAAARSPSASTCCSTTSMVRTSTT